MTCQNANVVYDVFSDTTLGTKGRENCNRLMDKTEQQEDNQTGIC